MSGAGEGRHGKQFTRPDAEQSQSRWRAAHREGEPIRGTAQFQRAERARNMPTDVKTGQSWSTWVPGRRQWLLATVIRRENGRATLLYDPRYGIGSGHNEQQADESTMLTSSNLFRFMDTPA